MANMFSGIGKPTGFSKAQASCQNASDHHKSWQIFHIFIFATMDELLLPYIRENLSSDSTPSVQGYHSWLGGVVDPNYKFMTEIVFSCSFALHCLFFGLDMPNYMET